MEDLQTMVGELLGLYIESEMVVIGEFSGDTLRSYRELARSVQDYVDVLGKDVPPEYIDLIGRIEEAEEWE